jgi:hypothetical protein
MTYKRLNSELVGGCELVTNGQRYSTTKRLKKSLEIKL